MRARGADFSSYQDLAQVEHARKQGIAFAFVKLTQGGRYVNPLASEQIAVLRARGVRVGVYHFLTSDVDGAAQWDHFEQTLGRGGKSMPVAVDHEPDHGVMPPDYIARAFIKRGQQRGFKVGRYASGSVFQRTPSLGENWRWVAWWAPTPPPFKWDVWQWSNGGGAQDWNYFNGDVPALERWMKKVGPSWDTIPARRWWLHDDFAKLARGPYRLPRLGAAVVGYLARHPKSSRLRLERK
jgi:GH25 family lysozyme M1 (1,4-beta-N-acetylmuramidase)